MPNSPPAKRLLLFGLFLWAFSNAAPAMSQSTNDSADLVLTNGAIYTMDNARTWAQALAVKNGKIIFVGTASGAKTFQGDKTKIVDLKGKMVMPGLHDSHVHLVDGGVDLGSCALLDCKTKEAVFEKIKDFTAKHKDLKWIRGSGWNLPVFKDGNPKKKDLDALVPDRPAWFESQDYHSGWARYTRS
jgi:predicted amidohydrolase YtcJ